ncbi:MAG: amidohydrolase, partial [Bacteroidales bacterium]|nr:amidohydrolase [Bacteroidales bacterium]
MHMNDMVLISTDDHLIEPPDMYDNHLSGDLLASAPKMKTNESGGEYWEYQDFKLPVTGLNAVMGRVPEEYGMEATSLSHMRRACYDPRARLDDMNVNGVAAALNFATAVVMDGSMFHRAADKGLAVRHMRAYNDWHVDEWCGAGPGRLIPCGVLPTWDMDATVAEIKRLADKGCRVVSVNENPTKLGLPSIHNAYWEPFWKALVDNGTAITLHIGAGNPTPHASMETPIEAWISTMQMSICVGLADWLNLEALRKYPALKISLAESGAGWVPFLLERSDYLHKRHSPWTHSDFGG